MFSRIFVTELGRLKLTPEANQGKYYFYLLKCCSYIIYPNALFKLFCIFLNCLFITNLIIWTVEQVLYLQYSSFFNHIKTVLYISSIADVNICINILKMILINKESSGRSRFRLYSLFCTQPWFPGMYILLFMYIYRD